MNLPAVHLAIMQPVGYVHSLGFLDQARYFRHQFRRMGAEVTISKNRLREDAVNFVFGAHLGFPSEWTRRHACVFVQLEQLGHGGAKVSAEYLDLLRRNAVVDYDAANLPSYAADPADVPLVPFLHAPYLRGEQSPALEDRPIDLLFFGSMNPRRRAFFERVEASGVRISTFDHAIYGAERDHYIRQAKAVLNCHFYETSRFEQARAFHCLSLGTPVISERTAQTQPPAAFEQAVFWLDAADPAAFFRERFATPAFFDEARARLAAFAQVDPIEAYADLLAFAAGFAQAHANTRPTEAWRPTRVNLGSGKDYKPGWLNIDILERAEPDLVLDLGQPVQLPLEAPTCRGGAVRLEPGQLDVVYANNVLEHVPDLPMLMTQVLALLKEGGRFQIEVPYEKALTAWQDPTHLRALNENSWLYYTDWFWYLGWFEHRFHIDKFEWLDLKLQPCAKEQAAFMKLDLRKAATTVRERTVARAMRPDFGGIDEDMDVFDALPDDAPAAPQATDGDLAACAAPAEGV
jgi:SAM-dependent methyltransferase